MRYPIIFLALIALSACKITQEPCTQVSEIVIQGKKDSVILSKPLIVVIDTINCPASDTPSVVITTKPCDCPPSVKVKQTDTIKITVENRKLINQLRDSIQQLKDENKTLKTAKTEVKQESKSRLWWNIGLGILVLFFGFIIYKILRLSSIKLK